ncbi:hypothetical protein Tco_0087165 [Tanacetum coccineum]
MSLTANPPIYDTLVKQSGRVLLQVLKVDVFFEIKATIDNNQGNGQIGSTSGGMGDQSGTIYATTIDRHPLCSSQPLPHLHLFHTTPTTITTSTSLTNPITTSPTPPPIPTPTSPPPPPPPETEPPTDEHIYEEQSPVHHHFSPSQAQHQDTCLQIILLQTGSKLISRIDILELALKQTKLTMEMPIVKLVKKVKPWNGIKRVGNLVLTDSKDEEPEFRDEKSS